MYGKFSTFFCQFFYEFKGKFDRISSFPVFLLTDLFAKPFVETVINSTLNCTLDINELNFI